MVWNTLEYHEPFPFQSSYPAPRLYEILDCDYALSGAYVCRSYLPERHTYALDIFVEPRYYEYVKKTLNRKSIYSDYYSNTHQFFILTQDRLYLNVIHPKESWLTSAINSAQLHLHPIISEPTLRFHWLILSKFSHGRRQDFLDIARLLARADKIQLSDTKELFLRWFPNEIHSLKTLYTIGKQELKKSKSLEHTNHPNKYSDWHHLNAYYLLQYGESDWEKDFLSKDWIDNFPSAWPKNKILQK